MHRREGAALFAAELSAAVMHFASQEFVSHVWRSDRLKKLIADLLRKLGHAETAEAWQKRSREDEPVDRGFAYSPDLVGLVEEGVLDFDLRLDDARPVLTVVDAIDHIGLAQSSSEFLDGLRPVLVAATANAERVLVHGACQGAALLHRKGEDPVHAGAALLDIVAETIESTLTPIALDLRWKPGAEGEQRLSGGPLFPFDPPEDRREFLHSLIDAIPMHVANLARSRLPLCVVNDLIGYGRWLANWRSQGADCVASLIWGLTEIANETPRETEIVVRLPRTKELTQQDVGILSAAVRAASQRQSALLRNGALDVGSRLESAIFFAVGGGKQPLPERLLEEFAKSYGVSIRVASPCRLWWGEGVADFCRWGPQTSALGGDVWYVGSKRRRSSYFLIPRREST